MKHIIDIHTHPAFFEMINHKEEMLEKRQQVLGLYKAGTASLNHVFNQMKVAEIDRLGLLPLDLTTQAGFEVVSNEEIAAIVSESPDRFIGFASVDPYRKDVLDVLERAFTDLGLKGLKLHPAKQRFNPGDAIMRPIYELCLKYDKPIIFHAGLSLEPDAPVSFGHPLGFEEVAGRYPQLRICLAHFGWPWVKETAALLLKYPNIYTDTALLYFDSAHEFYQHVFCEELGKYWIDRSLRHQVMFGSNNPRFEQIRMAQAIQQLGWRDSTVELVLRENALEFIREEN
ncbi:MAG TPA: amidohydrolase [Anaerolineaceae bacterium]|nr:amidohydrolase [Anaerolineaceae bacterium]